MCLPEASQTSPNPYGYTTEPKPNIKSIELNCTRQWIKIEGVRLYIHPLARGVAKPH